MIEIEQFMTVSSDWWKMVIDGVRLSHDSGANSDTLGDDYVPEHIPIEARIGTNDKKLLYMLSNLGPSHRKFLRQIPVLAVINAPLYWWKEFDTYKVGTTANSESTMHTIMKYPFSAEQFSHDMLCEMGEAGLDDIISVLNQIRHRWKEIDESKDPGTKKILWYNIIQTLPSSWNQRRLVSMNYEILKTILEQRKNHKLNEWKDFCKWILKLPLANELLVLKE
jgi:hypothetical protein